MDLNFIIQLLIFLSLTTASLFALKKFYGHYLGKKKCQNWGIDFLGLLIQGVLIPFLQLGLAQYFLRFLFPNSEGSLPWGWPGAIFLNLFVVDYIYYLFHLSLHSKRFWPLHFLHHTAEQMDVVVSSRNNLWVHFLLPYLWFNGLFYYLIDAKTAYLSCVAVTAMLDLWRHSSVVPKVKGTFFRALSYILITPYEHAWHHSRRGRRRNLGANWPFWDKLHKTYTAVSEFPTELGLQTESGIREKLFFPFQLKEVKK